MISTAKLFNAPAKIGNRVFTHGILDTGYWLWSHLSGRYQEFKLNVNTESIVDPEELGFDEDCHGYEPISYACFDTVMEHLEIDPERDVFLDYGCGLGRAVVVAATKPFKRVLGLELSPELSEQGRQNIELARKHFLCDEVEIVTANAMEYEVPDDVSVIFLWNSFVGNVLESVIDRIRESAARSDRKLLVVYALPLGEENKMTDLAWLSHQKQVEAKFWTGVDINIYQAVSSVAKES